MSTLVVLLVNSKACDFGKQILKVFAYFVSSHAISMQKDYLF